MSPLALLTLLACAGEGYLYGVLTRPERGLAMLAGALLLWSGSLTDLVGLGLGAETKL